MPRTRTATRRRRVDRLRAPRAMMVGIALVGATGVYLYVGYVEPWWALHGQQTLAILRWAGPLAGLLALASLALLVRRHLRSRVLLARRRAVVASRTVGLAGSSDRRTGKPLEFETAALISADGWRNARVHGGACDRGLDVSGWHPAYGLGVIQCKDYPNRSVGSQEMQAFLGTCWDILQVDGRRADFAMFVTTGRFTVEAAALASARREVRGQKRIVILVDGQALAAWRAGTHYPVPPYQLAKEAI